MSKKIYKATPLYPRTKKENIIDFPIVASDIDSENAQNNQVLIADGQGGTNWKTLLGTVSDVQLNNVSVVEDTIAKLNSDSQPVQNSTNLVESGGTYTVIKNEEERAKQAEADINNRINDLDLSKVGSENTNAYVKYVSQENGQLSAQAGTFDTTIGNDPSNTTAPTTSAVKTYVDTSITDNINALDVSDITSNLGVGKTIIALSETDGKISATASNISITSEQVNDKVTTITQESNNIPTTTAVKAYTDAVDSSAVHKAGEEVITGTKQFSNGLKVGNVNGGWKEYQNGSGFLKIAQGETDILQVENYLIRPETTNSVDLGAEEHTFKDLYLSGNLKDGSATRTISSIQPTYAYSNSNNLNLFDTTPTQNSTNPVTSGGIKDYVDTYGGKIDTVSVNNVQQTIINKNVDITVPTKTSDLTNDGNGSSNFATENFVNSSIATNTANFIGTFDSLTDLKADQQPKTNNDYAFVKNSTVYYDTTNPPTDFPTKADLDGYSKTNLTNYDYAWVINLEDNTKLDLYRYDIVQESWDLRLSKISKDEVNLNVAYNRYKYTYTASNASWEYEYTLNNSSFTNAQWQAINSGITDSLVSDLDSNTQARHTHANKAILDSISASFTTDLKNKLDGVESGAQVNQNAFSHVDVNGTVIDSSVVTDTLELQAGNNIIFSTDTEHKRIWVHSSNGVGFNDGDAINSIVFNTSTSISEMDAYLSQFTPVIASGVSGQDDISALLETDSYRGLYCVHLDKFGGTGYCLAICDAGGGAFSILQLVYVSEYSEANLAILKGFSSSITYIQGGWQNVAPYLFNSTVYKVARGNETLADRLGTFVGRDSNLWRILSELDTSVDVVDNLNSTAADKALSANQGRILNEMMGGVETRLTNLENNPYVDLTTLSDNPSTMSTRAGTYGLARSADITYSELQVGQSISRVKFDITKSNQEMDAWLNSLVFPADGNILELATDTEEGSIIYVQIMDDAGTKGIFFGSDGIAYATNDIAEAGISHGWIVGQFAGFDALDENGVGLLLVGNNETPCQIGTINADVSGWNGIFVTAGLNENAGSGSTENVMTQFAVGESITSLSFNPNLTTEQIQQKIQEIQSSTGQYFVEILGLLYQGETGPAVSVGNFDQIGEECIKFLEKILWSAKNFDNLDGIELKEGWQDSFSVDLEDPSGSVITFNWDKSTLTASFTTSFEISLLANTFNGSVFGKEAITAEGTELSNIILPTATHGIPYETFTMPVRDSNGAIITENSERTLDFTVKVNETEVHTGTLTYSNDIEGATGYMNDSFALLLNYYYDSDTSTMISAPGTANFVMLETVSNDVNVVLESIYKKTNSESGGGSTETNNSITQTDGGFEVSYTNGKVLLPFRFGGNLNTYIENNKINVEAIPDNNYDSLGNLPIVNTNLREQHFYPETNRYYRHIGETGTKDVSNSFNIGEAINSIKFNTGYDIDNFVRSIPYDGSGTCNLLYVGAEAAVPMETGISVTKFKFYRNYDQLDTFLSGLDYSGLADGEPRMLVRVDDGNYEIAAFKIGTAYMLGYMEGGSGIIVYSTAEVTEHNVVQGWQNLNDDNLINAPGNITAVYTNDTSWIGNIVDAISYQSNPFLIAIYNSNDGSYSLGSVLEDRIWDTTSGWQNLDENGVYNFSEKLQAALGVTELPITEVADHNGWNGNLAMKNQQTSTDNIEFVNGVIYFYDGSSYKAVNGESGRQEILDVSHGGTGVASFNNNNSLVLTGDSATSNLTTLPSGPEGYILQSNGPEAIPSWVPNSESVYVLDVSLESSVRALQARNAIDAFHSGKSVICRMEGMVIAALTSVVYPGTSTTANTVMTFLADIGDTVIKFTLDLPSNAADSDELAFNQTEFGGTDITIATGSDIDTIIL